MSEQLTNSNDEMATQDDLLDFLGAGGTFKTMQGIAPEAVESGYATALNLFENGRLKDAEKIFQFLCLLDHYDSRFFMGLGACRQQQGNYEQAIESYSYAALMASDDPRPPFHSAECHLALGRRKEAESGFFAASHFEGGGERFNDLRKRARSMYELMQKKKSTDA